MKQQQTSISQIKMMPVTQGGCWRVLNTVPSAQSHPEIKLKSDCCHIRFVDLKFDLLEVLQASPEL